MRRRDLFKSGLGLGAAAALAPVAAFAQDSRPAAVSAPLLVWAVRHAEKDKGRNPSLSHKGAERAKALARLLGDTPLDAIYSTPFKRTRSTAAPIAKAKSLEVTDYRTDLLKLLQARKGGNVLVVGHSNTTPDLLRALGVSFETKILGGYDDLFLTVVLPGGAAPIFQHLRYGAESTSSGH